ncbi:MAG TPA: response regulator [Candidatus Polarisedimenticolaceae bacterium]
MSVPKRVLVADDEPAILAAMAELLRLEGFEVAAAHDGPTALEAAGRFHPDAMILDVMMPGENGYRVSRAVKSATGDAPIPKVLIVTARRLDDDPEREALFLQFSMADGVLYKPFRLADLLDRLHQLLDDAPKKAAQAS